MSYSVFAAKNVQDLVNKTSDNKIMYAVNKISKTLINQSGGSGITLTNNEIKIILKVIRSLELLEKLLVKKEDLLVSQ